MNAPQKSVRESVSAEEWRLRCDLAAAYRLIALYGWDDLVFTHLSARLAGEHDHFLINPYGLMFDEITASSLVKIDNECRPVLPTDYPVNRAGFVIHSAIHAARHDVVCVMHTHTNAGVAVSAQQDGLLPISQQASISLASLGYHDYEGIAVDEDEKVRLQRDLGDKEALILRNHGLLSVGSSIPKAFLTLYVLERACQAQISAQSGGAALIPIDPRVLGAVRERINTASSGLGDELVWPALLRKLARANPGFDQ